MEKYAMDVNRCIGALEKAARSAGFTVEIYGRVGGLPLLGLTRGADDGAPSGQTVYLSAGIHGDEPAGPLALLELLESDALPRHLNWILCPLMNPSGLERGTRENREGIDLNRDYRDFQSREIRGHRDWLKRAVRTIDLGIHLHEDWEAEGFYLYELNFGGFPSEASALLQAVEAFLPIEAAECIDGREARDGIIRPKRLPNLPEGQPESIWLYQQYGGHLYTLETPSEANLQTRVQALKAAVLRVTAR